DRRRTRTREAETTEAEASPDRVDGELSRETAHGVKLPLEASIAILVKRARLGLAAPFYDARLGRTKRIEFFPEPALHRLPDLRDTEEDSRLELAKQIAELAHIRAKMDLPPKDGGKDNAEELLRLMAEREIAHRAVIVLADELLKAPIPRICHRHQPAMRLLDALWLARRARGVDEQADVIGHDLAEALFDLGLPFGTPTLKKFIEAKEARIVGRRSRRIARDGQKAHDPLD